VATPLAKRNITRTKEGRPRRAAPTGTSGPCARFAGYRFSLSAVAAFGSL